jgi:membrane protein DedA with SNARE-associated domain
VPVLVYSAWLFGSQIDYVVKYARRTEHGILIAVLLAAAIIGIKAWRRHKRRVALAEAAKAS